MGKYEGITFQINEVTISALLNSCKVGKVLDRNAQYECVKRLTEYFLGNNKEHKVYTMEEARGLIKRAMKAGVVSVENYEKIVISDIVDIIENIDEITMQQLIDVYDDFNKSARHVIKIDEDKHVTANNGISKFINSVSQNILSKRNEDIIEYAQESIDKLKEVASVYSILYSYLPEPQWNNKNNSVYRPADGIVSKISTKKMLEGLDNKNVKGVLEQLTSSLFLGEDSFEPAELEKLLKQTTTILTQSDIYKISSAKAIVDRFAEKLLNDAENEEFASLVQDNVTFKKLALKAGSFLKNTKEANEEVYAILTGESLSDIPDGSAQYDGDYEKDRYKDVHVDMSTAQLYHILTQVTSTLGCLRANRILGMVREFDEIIDRVFADKQQTKRFKREDFDVAKYLTGNNILTLLALSKDDRPQNKLAREAQISKYVQNIHTLNKIMSTSAIFEIMRNNMTILNLDNEYLESQLNSLVSQYGSDRKVLKEKINDFVNVRYSLTTQKEKHESKEASSVANVMKSSVSVSIKDVEDDYSQFEIDIDGGVYKAPTFTQKLNVMNFNEAMIKLRKKIHDLEDILNAPDDDKSDTIKVRALVKRIKQILDRLYVVIDEMENTDPKNANACRALVDVVTQKSLKNMLTTCRVEQGYIEEMRSDFYRGKKYHIPAEKEQDNLLYRLIEDRHDVLKSEDYSEEDKQEIIASLDHAIKMSRPVENRKVNRARIEGYDQSMKALKKYSLCTVAANSLAEYVM